MLVVGRRNAKNARKGPSSADEMQKTPKNSFSYPYDEQKTLKTAFRRGTINKKTAKTAFRRGTTDRKREKPRFVGVQSIKNGKNRLS